MIRSWRFGFLSSALFALAAVLAAVSPFILLLIPVPFVLCLWVIQLQPLRLPTIVFRAFGIPGVEAFLRRAVFEIGSPVRWIWLSDPKSRESPKPVSTVYDGSVGFFSWAFSFIAIGITLFLVPMSVRLALLVVWVLLGPKFMILLACLRSWRPHTRLSVVRTEQDVTELVAEIKGSRRLMPKYLRAIPVTINNVYCGNDVWFATVVAVTKHVPFALMDLTYLVTTDDGGPQSDGSPGIRINLFFEDRMLYQSSIHVFYTCREDRIEILREEMPEREIFPWKYNEATQEVVFDARELRRRFLRFLSLWVVNAFPEESRASMESLRAYLRSQGLSDDI